MNTLQQREALLDAGLRVAERVVFDQARLRDLLDEAQLPPVAFEHLFGDLDDFAHALQQRLYDDLRETIVDAMASQPPGIARLSSVSRAYLDGCLAHRGAFSWVRQVSHTLKPLEDGIRKQRRSLAAILSGEFNAIRARHPAACAQLFVAALEETASLEQASGRIEPDLRAVVRGFPKAHSAVAA